MVNARCPFELNQISFNLINLINPVYCVFRPNSLGLRISPAIDKTLNPTSGQKRDLPLTQYTYHVTANTIFIMTHNSL